MLWGPVVSGDVGDVDGGAVSVVDVKGVEVNIAVVCCSVVCVVVDGVEVIVVDSVQRKTN